MFSLKSLWKPWGGDAAMSSKPPERDEHMVVTETLMMELEYHCRELEQLYRDQENEKKRQQSGVDYSWLISTTPRTFDIPQLERLELEEMCYKVKPGECSKIVSLFRNAIMNEPQVKDTPKILKACIKQVLDQRPKEESFSEWMTKRTVSLSNIKLRPQTKVMPFAENTGDDVENQAIRHPSKSMSLPSFSSSSSVSTCLEDLPV